MNFDPESPNYFARRIGDRYVTIDSNGKLTYNGDWPNLSKYIYVSDFTDIAEKAAPVTVVPMGHGAISNPAGSNDTAFPTWTSGGGATATGSRSFVALLGAASLTLIGGCTGASFPPKYHRLFLKPENLDFACWAHRFVYWIHKGMYFTSAELMVPCPQGLFP